MPLEARRLITRPWTVSETGTRRWDNGLVEDLPVNYEIPEFYSRMFVETGPKPSVFATRETAHSTLTTTHYRPLYYKQRWPTRDDFVYKDFRPFDPGSAISFCMVSGSEDPLASWVPDVDTLVDRYVDRVYRPPSLINFVAELDDFPEMYHSLVRGLTWATSRRGRRYLTSYRGTGLDRLRLREDVVDPLSDAVLTTNLGLVPAHADIVELSEMAAAYLQSYRTIRHLMTRPGGVPVPWAQTAQYVKEGTYGWCKYRISGYRTRIYGAQVSATFPQGDPFTGIDTWSASGLHLDLQTVWNMLPFSFLVDYFVPIGEALRRARIFSNLAIAAGWLTDIQEGHAYFEVLPELFEPSTYGSTVLRPGIWSFDFKSYNRSRYIWEAPDEISVQDLSLLPSGRQLSNIAALANAFAAR